MGLGRRLTGAVADRLSEMGLASMLVWALRDNTQARHFYEALGGELVREQEITIGGSPVTEVAYGWQDIARLAAT